MSQHHGPARHHRPPQHRARRRGPSRRVRLRRTIVGVLLIGLVSVGGARWAARDHPVEAVAEAVSARPGVLATAADPLPRPPAATPVQTRPSSADRTGSRAGATTSGTTTDTVPQNGTGRLTVVAVPGPQSRAPGRPVRYTVEVEQGLGVDTAAVAATVRAILLDRKGWQGRERVRFVNVSPAQARAGSRVDIRVTLASPGLTDRLCAPLTTGSQVSCWNGQRAMLNLRRWQQGAPSYGDDVARYRIYQVNHEVGHGLGHGHVPCPGPGRRAPVMVQQTLGLDGCLAWPYPTGA